MSRATAIQLDSQGRFHIPEEHRALTGITRGVQVLGQNDRVEIWDSARFAEMESQKSPEDVSAHLRDLRIF